MRGRLGLAGWLWLLLSLAPALAGTTLSVRLVEASNRADGNAAGLGDVIAILRQNLAYKSYALIGSATLPLPAGSTVRLGEYEVFCSGGQQDLSVSVRQGGRVLLNTKSNLRDGKPLIVGGFPTAAGKRVLVFVAQ